MAVKSLTPYLFFDGQADEAIALYQQALKADVETVMRWGDHGVDCADALKGRVMHAALNIGEATVLLSDGPDRVSGPDERRAAIAINVDDADEMRARFDALAEGGSVVEKIHDAFWGDRFGVVRDAFGVTWMFTSPIAKG